MLVTMAECRVASRSAEPQGVARSHLGLSRGEARRHAAALAYAVSVATGVSAADIIGRRRTACVVAARHDLFVAMWRRGFSIAEIGKTLGRDHTTVIHALRKVLGEKVYERELAQRWKGRTKR